MDGCWGKFVGWAMGSKWDIVVSFDIVLYPDHGDGTEQLGEYLDWRLKLYCFSFQKLLSLFFGEFFYLLYEGFLDYFSKFFNGRLFKQTL